MENLPVLDSVEIRILGVLMEKDKTTPEYYPLTLNALTNGCNQKSSRNPIVNYSEEEVQSGLNSLKNSGLVAHVIGGGSRVVKYKHNVANFFELDDRQLAILCLLFLRGPLTPGEINSVSGRLYSFESLDSVLAGLESLLNREKPLVQLLPKKPGQKEARYAHLLGGEIAMDSFENDFSEKVIVPSSKLEERVTALENELALIKEKLGDLLK